MPKVAAQLNDAELAKEIAKAKADLAATGKKGAKRIAVGGRPAGLMLQVTPIGSMSWVYRTVSGGRRTDFGVGSFHLSEKGHVSLAKARKAAVAIATKIKEGRDPLAEQNAGRAKRTTFEECAREFLAENSQAWRNMKHRAQWASTLEKWVYPKIGKTPVDAITAKDVKAVLTQPIPKEGGKTLWLGRHETATRVRQRIEKVMRYAKAHGYREGENPAAWLDNLDELMPAVPKAVKKPKHHPALPYANVPAFVSALRKRKGTAARALEFTILTAARSGEVRNADWSDMDLERALWTIPDERMKAGKEHEVPLSDAALAILMATPEADRTGLVFPGARQGKPLSDMTLSAVLKRMGQLDITVHGFRSTFREWAGETTGHPREVIEHALAHQLTDKAEAAYQRGALLPKRVRLMADWAGYLAHTGGENVVRIKGAA